MTIKNLVIGGIVLGLIGVTGVMVMSPNTNSRPTAMKSDTTAVQTLAGKYRKPSDTELRQKLTPLQYEVTQEEGTEPAFHNEYWDNKEPGLYVDRVTGEPLFLSSDKYDSGTGWPSFTKPIDPKAVEYKSDNLLGYKRTEVISKIGQDHLGHIFDDGPEDKGGQRYCMNSAALRFIPKAELEKEGYGEYAEVIGDRWERQETRWEN